MKGNLRLLGGMQIKSPSGLQARPTTSRIRESVVNILKTKIRNCNWLDLCSGSGAMGCEALIRGASRVVAVELNKKIAAICHDNLSNISKHSNHKNSFEVINSDVVKWLNGKLNKSSKGQEKQNDQKFDLVYFDPPYKAKLYTKVLDYLIKSELVKKDGLVICEHSSEIRIEFSKECSTTDIRVYGSSSLNFPYSQSGIVLSRRY